MDSHRDKRNAAHLSYSFLNSAFKQFFKNALIFFLKLKHNKAFHFMLFKMNFKVYFKKA